MWPEAPTPPTPSPPSMLPFLGGFLLWIGIFVVLFVLPPCATSPALDLAALGGGIAWGLWRLVRILRPRATPPAPPVVRAPAEETLPEES